MVDHLDDIDDHVAAWDERTDAQGSKGVSLAVAGLSVGYMLALPALLVIGIYTFITIYAIVKAVDSGPDTADAGVVLIGVVGLVTFFVVLLGVGLWAIGRTADPKKRSRYSSLPVREEGRAEGPALPRRHVGQTATGRRGAGSAGSGGVGVAIGVTGGANSASGTTT